MDDIEGTYTPYGFVHNSKIETINEPNCNLIVKPNGVYICENCDKIEGLEIGSYGFWKDINVDYLCDFIYKRKDGKVYSEHGRHQVDEGDLVSIISFEVQKGETKQRVYFKKTSEAYDVFVNGKKDADIVSEFANYVH